MIGLGRLMGVRRLRFAATVSTAVHAAIVAWLAIRTPPAPVAQPEAAQPIEIVTVDPPAAEPAPLEVAMVPAIADAPASAPAAPARAPAQPAPAHIAGSASAPPAEVGPGSAAEPARRPDRGGLLAMRHPGDAPRPVLPVGKWDAIDHPPAGTSPEKPLARSGQLRESGGGTYRAETGELIGKVNPDGTVVLTDKPSASISFRLPTRTDIGRGITSWYEADKGTFGADADPALAKQVRVTSGASTDPQDPVTNRNADRVNTVVAPILGGKLELTDWLMRRAGIDPYASKKLAMLDATREERAQIGSKHAAEQLKRTAQLVKVNLDALWAATQDPQARKQALFELWDECVEAGDATAVEAGQAARRMVIGFIRGRIPAGGPGAFTPAELEAIARTKHSKAAFTPYE